MPARCFLAIRLTRPVLHALRAAREAFLDPAPAWAREKWVRPELLHVTLKFLGPLPDEQVGPALEALARACEGLPRPVLRLAGVRAVPAPGRATMLWATFDDPDGVAARLAGAVDEMLAAEFGVPVDTRRFMPHATLVRARRPRPMPPAALAAAQAVLESVSEQDRIVSVPCFTLCSSTLGPGGPTYDDVGEVGLD